ncbi:hypothetical protein KJZ99_04935 [bacterium]|nr:hypothetical protein [bacterium]
MKKWLSLIVMSSVLLGAAYFATATESARKMSRIEAARTALAEIDAMLIQDVSNDELLAKRAAVVAELAELGEAAPAFSNGADEGKFRALAEEQERASTDPAYYERLLERHNDGSLLSDRERLELLQSGLLKGKDDPAYIALVSQSSGPEARHASLYARMQTGEQLTPSEKEELVASEFLAEIEGSRDGRTPLDAQGGPNVYGYRWVDNLGGDTATYAWEEPNAPIELTAISSSDDASASVPFGFTFNFFGTNYTSGWASTNGVFGLSASNTSWSNGCPASGITVAAIMPYFDDGNTSTGASSDGGRVVYQQYADHVTITWDSVGTCCTNGTDLLDYQLQLWNDGRIKLQYRQIQKISGTSANGISPTIGIQNTSAAGLDQLNYYCSTAADSAYTNNLDGRAVWFYQLFNNNDFRTVSVVSPSPLRVSPSQVMNIVGQFRNIGNNAQSAPVKYRFNGGPVVSENTAVLALNQSEDHDFAGTETAPASVGDYELLMYTDLATDQDRTNDTLRVTVQVRDCYDEAQADAFVDAGTTCGAINDWANTCLGTADASEDYIYRWTTSTNGAWNIQLIASTTTTRGLVVSTSCPPDSFNCIRFANISQDTVTLSCVPLAAGTYYIMVDRSTGCDAYTLTTSPCTAIGRCCYDGGNSCANNGAYDCSVLGGVWDGTTTCEASPCPLFIDGGNTCAEAPLLPVPATVRGTLVGGTDNDPNFDCESNFNGDDYLGSNTAPDKWYKVVGTGNIIVVSLCNSYTTFDSQLLVTCSSDCQNFTCVGGNDDAFTAGCTVSSTRSVEWFCSELGREYYVMVDGYGSGTGGPYELAIRDSVPCVNYVDCAPEGRCCYLLNGVAACTDNMAAECSALGGQWNDAASCATSPCPVGRCCYLDNGIGACATNTQLECNALSGQWTSTTTCEAAPCPVGRCCYDNGDACANLMQIECTALGGLWDAGLTCEANPCPQILQGSDACAGAVLVPALGQTYVGTNVGYTAETGLPACATWYGATVGGVWYNIIGTGNTMTVALCDALTIYDSEIGVFCGETCESLLCVANDDDFCTTPALASQLSFCSVANAEYKLLITAFGSGTGTFAFTVSDDGTPCQPTVACPVTVVPCLPVTDLRAYVVSAGNAPNFIQLHFTAPQDANYKIWYSTNPNNDGNPDDGLDPQFILDDTVPALNGASVVYDGAAGFDGYRYYVVTADCSGN